MSQERNTLFRVLEALAVQYRLVLGLPFAAAVVTSVIVLVIDPTYAATASFVPENPSGPRLPSGLAGFASQLGLNLGGEANRSPAFYAGLLRSREVLGALLDAKIAGPDGADSITIAELYDVRGTSPELRFDNGLLALRNHITATVDQRTSVVRLTVESTSPTAARDVALLALERLADFNLNTRQSTVGGRRRFVEGRMAAAEAELRTAEDALRAFYDRNRQWQSSPQLRFEEQRLTRQVAVQQEVYLTLRREYEVARVEEVNNTPVFTIIDRPAVPGRRVRPNRTFTVLLVAAVVGVLACGLAILRQHGRDLLATQDPEYMRLRRGMQRLFSRADSAPTRPSAPR